MNEGHKLDKNIGKYSQACTYLDLKVVTFQLFWHWPIKQNIFYIATQYIIIHTNLTKTSFKNQYLSVHELRYFLFYLILFDYLLFFSLF